MKQEVTLSQAIQGYMLNMDARRLSSHTVADYTNTFRKFSAFIGPDFPIAAITIEHVEAFLALQEVSQKTLLNYHTGLSALWTWALKQAPPLATRHILQELQRPKPEKRAIVPFTEAEVRAMMEVLDKSRAYTRPGKQECRNSLPNGVRNRMVILLLLDTGIRADELCQLKIRDVDMPNKRITVMGKGKKERAIPLDARTAQAIWRYLATRPDSRPDDPLVVTQTDNRVDRHRLRRLLEDIGERAQVPNVHPHRFRHTFAINFLRNGGDILTLQRILGHATVQMVNTYLALAQVDVDAAHRRASPVGNWRL